MIKGFRMDRRPHSSRSESRTPSPAPVVVEEATPPATNFIASVDAAADLGGVATTLDAASANPDRVADFPQPDGVEKQVLTLEGDGDRRLPGGWVLRVNPSSIVFQPGETKADTVRAGTLEKELAPGVNLILSYSVVVDEPKEEQLTSTDAPTDPATTPIDADPTGPTQSFSEKEQA